MAAVTICSDLGAPQNKVWHCFHCLPSISHEVTGPDAMILVFWMLNFKPFRRRQWHPTPVLLPGKSHGRRSLVGCSPSDRYELDLTEWLHFPTLEKEMATHSSVLVWRIPGMGEPGGQPSMGSHRVGRDWSDLTFLYPIRLILLKRL